MASEDWISLLVVLVAGLACLALYRAIRQSTTTGAERQAAAGSHPEGLRFRVSSDGYSLEPVPLSSEFIDTLEHLRRTDPSLGSRTVIARLI